MDEKFSGMIPLIIFSSLLPVAVGIETGVVIVCFVNPLSIDIILSGLLWSLGFTLLSGVFVLFHLGHAERGPLIIHGISHSLLSREVILFLCFGILLVANIFYLLSAGQGTLVVTLLTVCAVSGVATVFTIGRVYNLPFQIMWRGNISSFGPFIGSMVIALAVTFILSGRAGLQTTFLVLLLVLVIVDALISILKLKRFIVLGSSQFVLVFPKQRVFVMVCSVIKLILNVSAVVLLIVGHYKVTLFLLTYGLFLDRTAFYASSAMKTPKEEMAILKNERMKAALVD